MVGKECAQLIKGEGFLQILGGQIATSSILTREVRASIPKLVKSVTGLPMALFNCEISSKSYVEGRRVTAAKMGRADSLHALAKFNNNENLILIQCLAQKSRK